MNDKKIKNLIENYRSSPEAMAAAREVSLLATVGPSASGKTTIMRALAASDSDFGLAVGESSRPRRPNEEQLGDMVHRSEAEIIKDLKAGNLFQVVTGPNGHLYCTRPQDFDAEKINLYPLIPLGVRQFRALPLNFFRAAFIVPASFARWQTWLKRQATLSAWKPEQLAGRLAEARASYEFALNDTDMRFVLNDEIKLAAHRLGQVGRGIAPDDEQKAREVAKENFDKLIKI